MKKIIKKSLSVLLALMLTFGVFAIGASAAGGSCGSGVNWRFDSSTGALVISGNGAMNDFINAGFTPWYSYLEDIKSISINRGITRIGNYSFNGCGNATKITLPDTVTSIGMYSFLGCKSVTNIVIPESVTSIENSAFRACESLTSISIHEGLLYIADGAFQACDMLVSITVDSDNPNYSSDEYGVLFNKNKTELIQYPTGNTRKSYSIPNTVEVIGNDSFEYVLLSSVSIPDSVTKIEDYAFWYCDDLKDINMPARLNSVGRFAFMCCPLIENVEFHEGLTSIGDWAFVGCTNLEYVHIPSSTTQIGESLFNVSGLYEGSCSAYICSDTENCYAKTYADNNGIEFVICDGHIQACDCMCHDNGIIGFFYRIVLFFQSLFGINKTCICGAEHY